MHFVESKDKSVNQQSQQKYHHRNKLSFIIKLLQMLKHYKNKMALADRKVIDNTHL